MTALTTYGKNPPDDYSDSQKRIDGLADSCGCEMENAAAGPSRWRRRAANRSQPARVTMIERHEVTSPRDLCQWWGLPGQDRPLITPRPPAEAAGAMTVQSTPRG
jgi:hypothetical protein